MKDVINRSDGTDVVTITDEKVEAASVALSALALLTAKGIRSGEIDRTRILPMLDVLKGVASPMEAMALRINEMCAEWSAEKACDTDIEAELRDIAKSLTASKSDRAYLSLSKGLDRDGPMLRPDRGVGR